MGELAFMPKPKHAVALDLLKKRNGEPSEVTLASGRVVRVWNIAWGYDLGNPVAHITTNISPEPEEEHSVDCFDADEIVRIVDPDNGALWFEASGPDAK
jgi:hypothetical protein